MIINTNADTQTNINTCFPPLLKPGIALSNPLISKSSRLRKGILQAFKSSVHTVSYCTNVSLYNREQKSRRAEIYQVMILFCGMSGLASFPVEHLQNRKRLILARLQFCTNIEPGISKLGYHRT